MSSPAHPTIELISYYDDLAALYPHAERATREWCAKHFQPDWVVFDVGANVGIYTVLFSKLAPYGQVHAFEPTSTIEMLQTNLEHNGCANVTVHAAALGQEAGALEDNIYRIWGADPERLPYRFETVDTLTESLALSRLDLLKIDVDSFDFEVLQGAVKTLDKFDPVLVVELNHALSRRGQSNTDAIAWLASQGYVSALVLDSDNFVLSRAGLPAQPAAQSFSLQFPREAEHLRAPLSGAETLNLAVHNDAAVAEIPAAAGVPADSSTMWNRRIVTPAGQWALAVTAPLPGNSGEEIAVDVYFKLRSGRVGLGILNASLSAFVGNETEARASVNVACVTLRPHETSGELYFAVRNWSRTGAPSEIDIFALHVRSRASHDC
ncbi:MAG: FkbM family methyltransferase [Hyphomonadaceae bacterium]